MGKVKVAAFSISIDGFGAGPGQDRENPLGRRGLELHQWFFAIEAFRAMHGGSGGAHGIDNDFAVSAMANIGAWVLGRNMSGPLRGAWPDHSWKGWWGDNPPYHTPVYVLTHHARPPLVMAGGTTFHFVTSGAEAALVSAKEAAAGKDVRIGGGVETIRQYLRSGSIDEMHLAISPVVLGAGENLFAGIDLPKLGFTVAQTVRGENATHVVQKR
jgi:dihydrofolate reductase